jgi:hypothetical protein
MIWRLKQLVLQLTQLMLKAAVVVAALATGSLAGLYTAMAIDRDVAGATLAMFTIPIGATAGVVVAIWLIRRWFD